MLFSVHPLSWSVICGMLSWSRTQNCTRWYEDEWVIFEPPNLPESQRKEISDQSPHTLGHTNGLNPRFLTDTMTTGE